VELLPLADDSAPLVVPPCDRSAGYTECPPVETVASIDKCWQGLFTKNADIFLVPNLWHISTHVKPSRIT
jgi:hypothetical protein